MYQYKTPLSIKRLKCSQCNKTYSFKRNWIRHMIFEHKFLKNEIYKKWLLPLHYCDICEETFSKRSVLVSHKILVHKENPENIEKFTENFGTIDDIPENISQRKRYASGCCFCKEIFKERSLWEFHMKSEHKKSSEEIGTMEPKVLKHKSIHSCKICEEDFLKIHLWEDHMRSVHEKTSEDIQTMKFKNWCCICMKTYNDLNQHIYLKHEKIEKLECSICNGKYVNKQVLKVIII